VPESCSPNDALIYVFFGYKYSVKSRYKLVHVMPNNVNVVDQILQDTSYMAQQQGSRSKKFG